MIDKIKIKELLPIILIISSIFSHLIFISRVGYKIQLTEFVFTIMSLLFILGFNYKNHSKILGLDRSLVFFGLVFFVNVLFHQNKISLTSILGSLYLIILYFIFSRSLLDLSFEATKRVLKKSSDIGFWILIVIGIVGFLLYFFLGYSKFVLVYSDYPYFGDVFRIKGFSYSPNLYISLLSFFTIIKFAFSRINIYHILIVFAIAILSITKEALILIAILFAIVLYKKTKYYRIGIGLVICAGLVYVFLSFFIISFQSNSETKIVHTRVQTKTPIFESELLNIYPTTYFEVFRSGVLMSVENPITGIGLGNFRKELDIYQIEGNYPEYFQTYDPLDSYFGLFSQLGIFYLLFLIVFFYSLIITLKEITDKYRFSFILLLIYISFESVALGTYNFRHYYLFFAIVASVNFFERNEIIKRDK